jgi:hypothetical protein
VTKVDKKKRRMKKQVVRPRVFIINRPRISEQKRCPGCTENSGMVTPDEAAALCGISTRMIYRSLEDGAIHFIETAEGELFICLRTLVANTKNSESRSTWGAV